MLSHPCFWVVWCINPPGKRVTRFVESVKTSKHILHVLKKVKRRFSPRELKQPYRRKHLAVVLRYGEEVTLEVLTPERMEPEVSPIVAPLQGRPVENLHDLLQRLGRLQK